MLVFCLFLSVNSAVAQNQLSGYYQLNVDVSAIKNPYKAYLYYIDKDGNHETDSTLVKNGRFVFKGTIGEPTTADLFLMSIYPDKPSFKNFSGVCTVFLEPGTINITTKDTTLNTALITGSKLNAEYRELVALYRAYEKQMRECEEKYHQEHPADRQGIDSVYKRLRAGEPDRIYKPFFLSHLDSYISLYVLKEYAYSSGHIDADKVGYLFSLLKKQYQDLPSAIILKQKMASAKTVGVGMQSPYFTQPDTAGNIVNFSSYKGKYVLIDFWASWCTPCRMENPLLLKAYDKYKEKNFSILSISLDKSRTEWLKGVKEDKLPWVQVSELKRNNTAALLYGVIFIPENFLIDPSGKIIAKSLRGGQLEDVLKKIFDK